MSWTSGGQGGTFNFTFGGPPQCNRCHRSFERMVQTPDGRIWCENCYIYAMRSPPPNANPPDPSMQSSRIALAIGGIRALFEACPEANRRALFRGLALAFHPDQGGDPAIMIALSEARDRYCP